MLFRSTNLSLNYLGQDIDITDSSTLLMSTKDGKHWIKNSEIYKKYPDVLMHVDDLIIPLMDPRVLLEYKKELSGEHQEYDISFLEKYNRIKLEKYLLKKRIDEWWKPDFDKLNGYFTKRESEDDTRFAYAFAKAFVAYLAEKEGEYNLKNLLDELKNGRTVTEAFNRAYFKTPDILAEEWKTDFLNSN